MERYEKIRVIGQGAFGKVFLLRRKSDKLNVVIKQIPVDDLPIEERRVSMNEVSVLKMLKHPNIVGYYDSFVEEKSLMIAMEYAPGGTLYEFIMERNGQLLLEEHILQLFVQILVAIQHVHSLNILHRDLKPQNIMLNKKRTVVKIGDFGISKVLSSKITSAQTVVGTPCYISPEICEGKAYRKKSDIWALGCVLYELTTLKKAFEGPNLPALVFKIMQAAESIPPINKKYTKTLHSLISSLLQRNPDDRPNTENVMSNPLLVNTLSNLGTDVGRLHCFNKSSDSSSVGIRMGSLGGSHRQKSFFEDCYADSSSNKDNHNTPVSKKVKVFTWGGGITTPTKLPPLIELGYVTSVVAARSLRIGVTEDGKLIKWELFKGSIATTGLTIASHSRKNETVEFKAKIVEGQSPGSSIVIKKACCGDLFTACLTDKGILMTFGSGINGCLGHGNYEDVTTLELVAKTLEYETVDVACGSNHVISVTADNNLFVWGRGESGQLGTGEVYSYCSPQLVQLPVGVKVKKLVCGPDCSVVITQSLTLYATGSNKYNKLGLDPDEDDDAFTSLPILSMKDRINDLAETSMIMSSVFKHNEDPATTPTPALTSSSSNSHIDKVLLFQRCPSKLLRDITDSSLSYNHSVFLNVSGRCITSGDNTHGELGRSSTSYPGIVDTLKDKTVTCVSCGDWYTMACTADGGVYSWGQSTRGRLGRESVETNIPGIVHLGTVTQIHSLNNAHGVTMIACCTEF